MSYEIEVENIKCGGCASSIRKGLLQDSRIESVEVDVEAGKVSLNGDELARNDVIQRLLKMGYPEKGSVEGIQSAKAKAKSFASCAIGRFSTED